MGAARTALVTGGTGFTGANLIQRLVAHGWTVHAIVRPGSKTDLLDECLDRITLHVHDGTTEGLMQIVKAARPDIAFHLAALFIARHTSPDVLPLVQNNIALSTQLAEALAENGVDKLINTGTSWQHYENRDYAPTCLYAATKQAFEAILQYYVDVRSMKAISLQLFDSYGPNDPRPKLFRILEQAEQSSTPILMSPGEQQIDLVYIDDVVTAFLCAAERLLDGQVSGHERYAVSSGNPLRLKDLVAVYERVLGLTLPIQWGGRPYRDMEVMETWNKGSPVPGWKPSVPLEEGIRRTRCIRH